MTFREYIKKKWAPIVATAFGLGVIAQAVTVYYFTINFGWEVWLEIPLILGLLASVWLYR